MESNLGLMYLIIFPIAVTIVFLRAILFWVNYVQIKQYRVDRIKQSIKTRGFWKLFFSKPRIILLGIFLLWQVLFRFFHRSIPQEQVDLIARVMVILVFSWFVIMALHTVFLLARRQLQTPTWTKKSIILIGLVFALELFIAIPFFFYPEQMMLIELLQPFIVFIIFGILFIPNVFLHKRIKQQAAEKRKALNELQVIGITGSYGKSTMKEYLAFLLEEKFNLLKTPDHVNVDTGVAQLVLNQLNESHELFIAEMGAYKRGEIKSLCHIAQPTIAVMTGLGTQHLELFGSQENIELGKFELVDAVEGDENIFANKDSQKLEQAFKKRNKHPNWYGFSIEDLPIKARLTKAQRITLDGAIKVAQKLGMSSHEINQRLSEGLPDLDGTMRMRKAKNGGLVIDDTYNASTEAILAALEDLQGFNKPKKIFVFKEVIELGKTGNEEHLRIAKAAAESATHIIFLPGKYTQSMREFLLASGFPREKILDPSLDLLTGLTDQHAVVLLEGRDAQKFLKPLI